MTHSSLYRALLCAGALALAGAGVAQAETFDSPQQAGEMSTMTQGAPNLVTNNIPNEGVTTYTYTYPSYTYPSYSYSNPTTVLGAGPATVTTYTYTYPAYASTTTYLAPPVVNYDTTWGGASETSNVPLRAGEVTTMTGGAPNMLTNNYAW
jgi:hypothetical protein